VTKIIDNDITGEINLSGRKPVTKFEWAKLICEMYGLNGLDISAKKVDRVNPPTSNFEMISTRLNNLGIDITSLERGYHNMQMAENCSFNPIYNKNLNDVFKGQSSSKIRHKLGSHLAQMDNIRADAVVPIPQSGIYPAIGYANESGIPIKFGISKQNDRRQTLYDKKINRTDFLENNMKLIPDMISDKEIIIVDEAILSGKTINSILKKLDETVTVHLRISSPPVKKLCPAGVYPSNIDLFSSEFEQMDNKSTEVLEQNMADELDIKSVSFIPREKYINIMGEGENICDYCFR
jgi:amidophosphoribosyltransferase